MVFILNRKRATLHDLELLVHVLKNSKLRRYFRFRCDDMGVPYGYDRELYTANVLYKEGFRVGMLYGRRYIRLDFVRKDVKYRMRLILAHWG